MPLLWHHRCSHSCSGRGWLAWPGRTNPDLSRSYLPYHVHFQAQHSLVPFENPLAPDRNGAVCAGRRAGPFRRRAGLRPPTSHHHHLADSCWRARADLARTLLLPSPPPTPPARRTANTAPQLYTVALALAGHRPPLENYSCTPFELPHANLGAEGHSLLAAG